MSLRQQIWATIHEARQALGCAPVAPAEAAAASHPAAEAAAPPAVAAAPSAEDESSVVSSLSPSKDDSPSEDDHKELTAGGDDPKEKLIAKYQEHQQLSSELRKAEQKLCQGLKGAVDRLVVQPATKVRVTDPAPTNITAPAPTYCEYSRTRPPHWSTLTTFPIDQPQFDQIRVDNLSRTELEQLAHWQHKRKRI